MGDLLGHWELRHDARPWLLNSERAGSGRGIGGYHGRAALTTEWREAFAWLATAQRIPQLAYGHVEIRQLCRDRRLPDTGSCFPTAKAAIDGLVDAGVLKDDGPAFVRSLTFIAPETTGEHALVLQITGPVLQ